jgi:hypothetical protein
MNETITAALREHAQGDIHIDRLLGAVHAGARRRQRRRRAVAGGAVIVVAVAALVGVRGVVPGPAPVAGPASAATPRPPRLDGAATVATSPAELGADPTRFHLDLIGLNDTDSVSAGARATGDPDGWSGLSWAAQDGHETLAGQLGSGHEVRVEADRDRDGLTWRDGPRWPVTVAGQPAEAIAVADGSYAVQWQPLAGVWAQVDVATTSGGVRAAIDLAERVRLDRVYRCAAAFRLIGVAPYRLTKCSTDYWRDKAGEWVAGSAAWFTMDADGPEYLVAVGAAEPVVPNATIAGRAVEIVEPTDASPATLGIRYPLTGRVAYFWAFGPDDESGVVPALVAGFTSSQGDNPDHWPSSPFD